MFFFYVLYIARIILWVKNHIVSEHLRQMITFNLIALPNNISLWLNKRNMFVLNLHTQARGIPCCRLQLPHNFHFTFERDLYLILRSRTNFNFYIFSLCNISIVIFIHIENDPTEIETFVLFYLLPVKLKFIF